MSDRPSFDTRTEDVIGAMIEVHRRLGPGLLESTYEMCLCILLSKRGLRFERQKPLTFDFEGTTVDCAYRMDVVVNDEILIELKAVDRLLPIHEAQLVTYLRLSKLPVGLLVNFNSLTLIAGLRRLTREHPRERGR